MMLVAVLCFNLLLHYHTYKYFMKECVFKVHKKINYMLLLWGGTYSNYYFGQYRDVKKLLNVEVVIE